MTTKTSARSATKLDIILGKRVRAARENCSLSQQDLASRLNISFQQLQKYEHGLNRISVGRFLQICDAIGVHRDLLLDGLTEAANRGADGHG